MQIPENSCMYSSALYAKVLNGIKNKLVYNPSKRYYDFKTEVIQIARSNEANYKLQNSQTRLPVKDKYYKRPSSTENTVSQVSSKQDRPKSPHTATRIFTSRSKNRCLYCHMKNHSIYECLYFAKDSKSDFKSISIPWKKNDTQSLKFNDSPNSSENEDSSKN